MLLVIGIFQFACIFGSIRVLGLQESEEEEVTDEYMEDGGNEALMPHWQVLIAVAVVLALAGTVILGFIFWKHNKRYKRLKEPDNDMESSLQQQNRDDTIRVYESDPEDQQIIFETTTERITHNGKRY